MSKENQMIPSLSTMLFSRTEDVLVDYAEITLDSVIDNEVLKEIPIVKTVCSMSKMIITIRDRQFLRNTIIFLKKFQEGKLTQEEIDAHVKKFYTNPRQREKEMECIMLYLDNYRDKIKAQILANIYLSYIKEEMNWLVFLVYTEFLDRICTTDLPILQDLSVKSNYGTSDSCYPYSLKRLDAVGLIDYFNGMKMAQKNQDGSFIARINLEGRNFVKIGLEGVDLSDLIIDE